MFKFIQRFLKRRKAKADYARLISSLAEISLREGIFIDYYNLNKPPVVLVSDGLGCIDDKLSIDLEVRKVWYKYQLRLKEINEC